MEKSSTEGTGRELCEASERRSSSGLSLCRACTRDRRDIGAKLNNEWISPGRFFGVGLVVPQGGFLNTNQLVLSVRLGK